MAVLMGLIVVNLIKPGIGSHVNLSHIDSYQLFDNHNENSVSVVSILSDSVPSNIVSAAASENMLGIIFFSLVFASALLALGSKGEQLKKVFEETNDVFLLITNWIMKLAPLGVFALLASLVGQTGLDIFKPVAFYVITVLIGLFLHLFVTLSGILLIIVKYSPLQFFKKVFPAIATAFSTASSIATLPVTMECLEKKVGVSKKVVGFVAPLGATVNMDGTALYEAVAAVFIAQVFGFDMSLTQQAIIMLTATLASVGAAGIPSAGLVTLAMVLQSVNLPLEGLGILLAVDRVLDMFRTTINVISDCVAALFVASLEGETFQSQETTQGYVSKN
jgi:Na+/H+-dicarboxylate symporter